MEPCFNSSTPYPLCPLSVDMISACVHAVLHWCEWDACNRYFRLNMDSVHRACFNFGGVCISWILAFIDVCMFVFMDGHVLPFHKSLT